jgi:hypothetical protein
MWLKFEVLKEVSEAGGCRTKVRTLVAFECHRAFSSSSWIDKHLYTIMRSVRALDKLKGLIQSCPTTVIRHSNYCVLKWCSEP